jgi:small subunit ribosomal protein S21
MQDMPPTPTRFRGWLGRPQGSEPRKECERNRAGTRPRQQRRSGPARAEEEDVRDNNVDQALRALKKKMQREGVFREMKLRRHYEKPSEKKAREQAEAVRRWRKLQRKRREREGF